MKEHATIHQEGSISFRPHARLIRLLGDELISDEVMAIVELVKNSYDADATYTLIHLDTITQPEMGCICIRDDGTGMDIHTLLNVWMEPATSHKRRIGGQKVRTPIGRIQTGEKGVGRFAADKLGAELELVTKTADAEKELVLHVNWNWFEENKYLDDVKSYWHFRKPIEFVDTEHGTLLKIRSLRATWNQEMVDRLKNGLLRLISPFSTTNDFSIEVLCPEFPSVNGKLINHILDTAPYKLSGHIDKKGIFYSDTYPSTEIDLKPLSHNHFLTSLKEIRDPQCGPFKVSLNIWDLEIQTGKGFGVDRPLREAIKSSSGISIYRDDFRIWPYGEKDDDWLELNQRRVNNPTLRISNNQIIGFIEITHADNSDLKDRTSREGLIDTPAFFDLKALVLALISELEIDRFNQRRQIETSPLDMEEENDELLSYLSKLKISEKAITPFNVKEVEKLYRKRMGVDQAHYNRIVTMAGIGVAAELLSDAFTQEISSSAMLLNILQGEVRARSDNQLQQLTDTLIGHVRFINEQLDMMEPLYHPRTQTHELLDVKGVAYDVISMLRYKLSETEANATITGIQGLGIHMGRGHLMMATMIVVDNALKTMREASTPSPCVEIEVIKEEDFSGLLIKDNGPGIPEKHHKLIFEPGFSSRKTGRGLGLHIARDILAIYNCSLELVTTGKRTHGATFAIRLDKRRIPDQIKNLIK